MPRRFTDIKSEGTVVRYKSTDVSEEPSASAIRVEVHAKQGTGKKQAFLRNVGKRLSDYTA